MTINISPSYSSNRKIENVLFTITEKGIVSDFRIEYLISLSERKTELFDFFQFNNSEEIIDVDSYFVNSILELSDDVALLHEFLNN